MKCYYRWLPELGSERFLGIEKRLYLTQRTASGPRPFFNSQTRKAASSSFLVRKSVSTGACTMVSSSSTTMRAACGAERRDFAAENSVFRSFEVLFLFTIAGTHLGKLELIRFARSLWTHDCATVFQGNCRSMKTRKRRRPVVCFVEQRASLEVGGQLAKAPA